MREIQLSLGQLPDMTLIHVKGHQDLHTANRRLPLLAQLNVDADDKAGEYQRSYGKAHLFVLMSGRLKRPMRHSQQGCGPWQVQEQAQVA